MFELVIFLIAYFGTDFEGSFGEKHKHLNNLLQFLRKAKFACKDDSETTRAWYIEDTPFPMTLFKLHFIVIFMYTMIFQIVLFIIPYKYDRLERTPAEEKADKKRRAKARKKKQHRNKN